jgi:hypothetical protein
LRLRLNDPGQHAASGKLSAGILKEAGAQSAFDLSGNEFNLAAESYYRETLRKRHMEEALQLLLNDLQAIDREQSHDCDYRRVATQLIGTAGAADFLESRRTALVNETLDHKTLAQCIRLTLLAIYRDRDLASATPGASSRR